MTNLSRRVRRPSRAAVLILASTLSGAGAVGCSAAGEAPPAPARYGDGSPALHAVQDRRLRELMQEMNALLFERMPTELELDRERRLKAAQIAAAAEAMARTVDDIAAALPRLDLTPEEQAVFGIMAERLRERVATLLAQARANYIDGIPATLDAIGATCDGCHQLFRTPR